MKITSDDIEWFKKAADTVSKGYYPNGQKAIDEQLMTTRGYLQMR